MGAPATVRLLPMRSSRAAEQPPDHADFSTHFESLPREGETIRLGEDWGEEMAGRTYMVDDVEWPLPLNGRSQRPLITASRF